ncbi:MAG: amidohydrolase family protein [Pseudomonadota bacterium]
MQIDAHQHYWHPARGDYGWMPKDNPVLARPYGPADLAPHLAAHGIDATVLVQAAPSIEETEYMLGLADADPRIAGVVGWVDFEDLAHRRHLDRFAAHPKFVGLRPMIQDIPDVDWMLRADVAWGFKALTELGLTLDALGFPQHLPNFATLLDRHPDMRVVVDHCMKPQIRDGMAGFAGWAEGMRRLAGTGAYVKLSGLVTEAAPCWTLSDLRPWADTVLEAFGPSRVIWGSDWPVVRLAAEYGEWRAAAEALCGALDAPVRQAVFGGNAIRAYRLAL